MLKKKGFTMFELVIVVGIITILSGVTFVSINKSRSIKDLKILKENVNVFVNNLALIADSQDERLDISFNFDKKLISVRKNGNIIKELKLPSSFEYEDSFGRKIINRQLTPKGNMNTSFSMYTFDSKSNAVFKHTFVTNRKYINTLIINNYKPKVKIKKGEHKNYLKWEKVDWSK